MSNKLTAIYEELFPELSDEEFYSLPSAREILEAGFNTEELVKPHFKTVALDIPEAGYSSVVIQIKDKLVKVEGYRAYDEEFYKVDANAYYVEPVQVTRTEYHRV